MIYIRKMVMLIYWEVRGIFIISKSLIFIIGFWFCFGLVDRIWRFVEIE